MMFLDSLGAVYDQTTIKTKRIAYLLDPILMIALEGGPMKVMPSLSSCSAKFAFSLRKP
jgi:hypothetical protein